jgi:photosynthetic reaction center cytochrome c subunit
MNTKHPMRNAPAIFLALAMCLAAILWVAPKSIAQAPARSGAAAPNATSAQKPSEMEGKTAEQYYMNVQALTDIPATQLLPSMRYITAALGVRCDYCHDPKHFDNDDKPEKQRARNMMKMMFAINKDNFNGHREVTCFTCHHGMAKASSTPLLPDAAAAAIVPRPMGAPGSKPTHEAPNASAAPVAALPTADQILDRYIQAIGGADAVKKNTTRIEKGTVDSPSRGMHASIETYRKAPDEAFAILHAPPGDTTEGFDGAQGWERVPNGQVREETGDELVRVKQWASFYLGQQFKQDYSRLQVDGMEKIAGQDAYRVLAWWVAGGADRLYFDAQSGLLLRVFHQIDSPLGALPLQTDYEDYRDVNGVKIPFLIRVARVDGTTTYQWSQMLANVPVDDRIFQKPEEKPAGKP